MACKVFASFDEADEKRVTEFLAAFPTGDEFVFRQESIPRDLIELADPDHLIREIRRRYLVDSTVTMVMIGRCTWARRFVDWEVQASLHETADELPNGLLAVLLDPDRPEGRLPRRVWLNVESGYARFQPYPPDARTLSAWIDDAYQARTDRAGEIINDRERQPDDDACP